MKKLLVACLLLIVAGSFALYQWQNSRFEEERRAASAEISKLRQELWDAQKRNQSLAADLAAAQAAANGTAPATPAATAARGGANGQQLIANLIGTVTARLNDPEAKRLMGLQQRAQLDGRYADLFRSLGLPPAELERFKTLLVDRQSAGLDIVTAAAAQGIDPLSAPDALRDLARQTQGQVEGEIRTLLGDAGYERYQNYERTTEQRAIAKQLEQRLSYSETPLTPDQYEQVVQALAPAGGSGRSNTDAMLLADTANAFTVGSGGAATVAFGNQRMLVGATNVMGGPTISNDAVARAGGVLSGPQLSALQQIQQEQQAQQQMAGTMRQTIEQNLGGRGGRGGGGRRGGN